MFAALKKKKNTLTKKHFLPKKMFKSNTSNKKRNLKNIPSF